MRALAAFIVASVVAGLAAPPGDAGTFDVDVCGAASSLSWLAAAPSNSQPGTLTTPANCRLDPNDLLEGLAAADQGGAPNTPAGATASWTVSATPGTRIASVRLRRYLGKRDNSWNVWTRTAEGRTIESCEIASSISCAAGAAPTDPASATTYTGLDTASLSWGVSCRTTIGTCPNGLSLHYAWAVVYGMTVTVDDPSPPQLQPLAGSVVAARQWHSGIEQATVVASDASGAKRLELLVDGAVVAAADQSCDYTRMRPCPPDAQFVATVDLASLRDGAHAVAGRAVDAAGQAATTAATTVAVDTRAPAAPTALSAESNDDSSITARWVNPDQLGGAPIAAVHYQFCPINSDAGCAGGGIASGDGISSLERIRPPAGGAPWDLVVWLQDAAGHADRASAARQTVVVRPPGSGPGPARPRLLPRRPAGLRIVSASLKNGRLQVRGVAARSLRGRVNVSIRRTRTGRALASRAVPARMGQFTAVLELRRRGLPRRGYLTVHFAGDKEHRAATVARRFVRSSRGAGRSHGPLPVTEKEG